MEDERHAEVFVVDGRGERLWSELVPAHVVAAVHVGDLFEAGGVTVRVRDRRVKASFVEDVFDRLEVTFVGDRA